ncbi:MAG: 6-pyruvoyl-tetrahydropterin synthase-related protein [Myxococcota bacterium]
MRVFDRDLPPVAFHVAVLVALGLSVVTGAWSYLQGGSPLGDDASAHLTLSMHVADLLRSGQTDFFWEQSNLGLPLYASYHPLSSFATGSVMALFGDVDPTFIFKLFVVGLWATMPTTWFVGARWCGASRGAALLVGALTLFVRDPLGVGLSLTSVAHVGLYAQTWGMWWLPLAVGAMDRALRQRSLHPASAAVILALTALSHVFIGMLAGIFAVCIVLANAKNEGWLRRLAIIAVGTALLCAFWLVPMILTRDYLGGLHWRSDAYDGWGFTRVVKTFGGGGILDHAAFPWLTIAVVLGGVTQRDALKANPLARGALLFAIVCSLMMGGKTMWGAAYSSLPLHRNVNPMRYLVGLQAACLVVIAVSWTAWLRRLAGGGCWPRGAPVLVFVLACVCVGNRHGHVSRMLRTFDAGTFATIAHHLAQHPEHRFAVDSDLNTSSHLHRDLLPRLARRAQLQSYALGYHATASTYYAEYVDYQPTWFRLFNVGELVSRNGGGPVRGRFPVNFEDPPYTVHGVPGASEWGYFDLVRLGPTIRGPWRVLRPLIRSAAPRLFEHRQVAPLERADHVAVDAFEVLPETTGMVLRSTRAPASYTARVRAGHDEHVLFKMTYFPFWRAWVDGDPVEVVHVAPNFMAVPVDEGEHEIVFAYRNPLAQKLAALGSCLAVLVIVGWRLVVWRRRRRDS